MSSAPRPTCDRCKATIAPDAPLWRISVSEELDDGTQVEVRDARVAWQYCARCARSLDLERLPPPHERVSPKVSPEARDELAQELGDFFVEALGEPDHVLHHDGDRAPHVDVFIYAPRSRPWSTWLSR